MSGSEDTDLRIIRAKNAEKSERYLDMAIAMKDYVKSEKGLNTEHRNLLSVAYKNVVGARRSSWRVISSIENKDGGEGQTQNGPAKAKLAKGLREKVAKELEDICSEVLELLDHYLIDKANTTPEANIFYCKMKGDYHRYLAEVCTDDDNKQHIIEESEKAYNKAFEEAKVELKPTDPIRLGLALNFSVFHFEIKDEKDKACELAKTAFDAAIAELDQVEENFYKDSTLIMQLLRDNLTLWQSESSQDERDGD